MAENHNSSRSNRTWSAPPETSPDPAPTAAKKPRTPDEATAAEGDPVPGLDISLEQISGRRTP